MLGLSDVTRTSRVRSLTARELPLAVEGYLVYCIGDDIESISEKNNDDESTRYGDILYDIFEEEKEKINFPDTLWVKPNKEICQDRIIRKTCSDVTCDGNYLKIKWLHIKT